MRVRWCEGLVAAAVALALAGCGAIDSAVDDAVGDGIENAVEDAIERGTDGSVDVDLNGDGVEVPESWPAGVPVPEGTILSAISESDTTILVMAVAGSAAVEAYIAALEGAGLARGEYSSDVEVGGYAELEGDGISVTLVWGGDPDGETSLQVAVLPLET
ncbi:hypothetical protein [Demequina sp. NBRC 110052]|uniref:hypothetical protein n=1 Tax=Demequina sp. NBRC 110052 TaxID=1570341 RepID=UPI0009FD5C5D|nr:hypothetical protein [Demequina sp. NBRC 110052]